MPKNETEKKRDEKFLGFDRLVNDFTVPEGQSRKDTVKKLSSMFPTKCGNQQLILDGIRLLKPDYAITPEDEAQRKERRQISRIARENLFNFVYDNAELKIKSATEEEIKNPSIYRHMARGFSMLFDFRPGPEAAAHNEKMKEIFMMDGNDRFVNSDINQRTEVIVEFIDRQLNRNFDELYNMTDRQVAENFVSLYPLYVLAAEGADGFRNMNGKAFNLSDDQLERLSQLRLQHQGLFSYLRSRFQSIANPNYEIFHYERLYTKNDEEPFATIDIMNEPDADDYTDQPEQLAEDKARYAVFERFQGDKNVRAFYDYTADTKSYSKDGGIDAVNRYIRRLNIPEDLLKMPYRNAKNTLEIPLMLEVTRADGTAIPEEDLMNGDLLTFVNPMDQKKHFLKSNGITMEEIDITRLPDPLRTEPDRLMKMLDAANPWRIRAFTGSEEFNEMQKALRDVQTLKEKLGPDPTRERKEELNQALDTLQQKAENYVGYKGGDPKRTTKESERARINVGTALVKFAKEGKTLLAAHNELLDMTYAMNLNEGAIKNEQDFQLDMKLADHYQNLDLKDPMFKLGNGIYDSIYAAGKDLPENPLDLMARMVVYDLVMRERIAKKDGEPHTIEEMYLKNPEKFVNGLKESETLKKAAEGMDKDKFHQLVNQAIGANGIQPLTSQVLAEQARQTAINQPEMQSLQNQGIEAPKPLQGPNV